MLNNEPFGVLEQQMVTRYGKKLEGEGAEKLGALILIDPFPEGNVEFRDGQGQDAVGALNDYIGEFGETGI